MPTNPASLLAVELHYYSRDKRENVTLSCYIVGDVETVRTVCDRARSDKDARFISLDVLESIPVAPTGAPDRILWRKWGGLAIFADDSDALPWSAMGAWWDSRRTDDMACYYD